MTDNEYASRIYCAVLNTKEDEDIYVRGVLDMLGTLAQQEQFALEYRCRDGLTYAQISKKLGGICIERVRQIIQKAMEKLRHPSRIGQMRISMIIEKNNTLKNQLLEKSNLLSEKNALIDKLYSQIGSSAEEAVSRQEGQKKSHARKIKIEVTDFSTRTYNALREAGINDYDTLLSFPSFDDIMCLPNFGQVTILEIACKMYEYGYTAWVRFAAALTNERLRAIIENALN